MVNESAKKSIKNFFAKNSISFYEKDGVTYLRIITKDIPCFNFLEKQINLIKSFFILMMKKN